MTRKYHNDKLQTAPWSETILTQSNDNRGRVLVRAIYLYLSTPSRRLRAGTRQCGVSGRNTFKKQKVPIRFVSWSGIKDDRVIMLKSETGWQW